MEHTKKVEAFKQSDPFVITHGIIIFLSGAIITTFLQRNADYLPEFILDTNYYNILIVIFLLFMVGVILYCIRFFKIIKLMKIKKNDKKQYEIDIVNNSVLSHSEIFDIIGMAMIIFFFGSFITLMGNNGVHTDNILNIVKFNNNTVTLNTCEYLSVGHEKRGEDIYTGVLCTNGVYKKNGSYKETLSTLQNDIDSKLGFYKSSGIKDGEPYNKTQSEIIKDVLEYAKNNKDKVIDGKIMIRNDDVGVLSIDINHVNKYTEVKPSL